MEQNRARPRVRHHDRPGRGRHHGGRRRAHAADYEATAEKTIAPTATPGVLTQELDKLEKEIGQ